LSELISPLFLLLLLLLVCLLSPPLSPHLPFGLVGRSRLRLIVFGLFWLFLFLFPLPCFSASLVLRQGAVTSSPSLSILLNISLLEPSQVNSAVHRRKQSDRPVGEKRQAGLGYELLLLIPKLQKLFCSVAPSASTSPSTRPGPAR